MATTLRCVFSENSDVFKTYETVVRLVGEYCSLWFDAEGRISEDKGKYRAASDLLLDLQRVLPREQLTNDVHVDQALKDLLRAAAGT